MVRDRDGHGDDGLIPFALVALPHSGTSPNGNHATKAGLGYFGDPKTSGGAVRFTVAITREADWFIARCLEVEVASQGESVEEARSNLKEALELYFED